MKVFIIILFFSFSLFAFDFAKFWYDAALSTEDTLKKEIYLLHSLKINPDYKDAIKELGILYYISGEFEKANKYFITLPPQELILSGGQRIKITELIKDSSLKEKSTITEFEKQIIEKILFIDEIFMNYDQDLFTYEESAESEKISEHEQDKSFDKKFSNHINNIEKLLFRHNSSIKELNRQYNNLKDIIDINIKDISKNYMLKIEHRHDTFVYNSDSIIISLNIPKIIPLKDITLFIKFDNEEKFRNYNLSNYKNYLFDYDISNNIKIEYYIYISDIYDNYIYIGQEGIVETKVEPIIILCIDDIPPQINHNPVMFSDASKDLNFVSVVKDNIQVEKVFFHYRSVEETDFQKIDKIKMDEYTYQTSITKRQIVGDNIEYFISAVDVNNNIAYYLKSGNMNEFKKDDLFTVEVKIPLLTFEQKNYELVTGAQHTLYLMEDKTILAWGNNIFGQLGNGTNKKPTSVVKVKLDNVIALAAGRDHSLALLNDGTVWAWGSNNNGQLGNDKITSSFSPVKVAGLNNIVKIEAGFIHNLALDENGYVWGWGNNRLGQLGNENLAIQYKPSKIKGLRNIRKLACGYGHSLAVNKDGDLFVWGDNLQGQLGIGTTKPELLPVANNNISDVLDIFAGKEHSIALKNDGSVWSWGDNKTGQLGIKDITISLMPIEIKDLKNIKKISSFSFHNLALSKDNKIYGWGNNFSNQIGFTKEITSNLNEFEALINKFENNNKYIYTPIILSDLKNIISISAGADYSAFRDKENNLWFLGDNRFGQACDQNFKTIK
jgi:alpha-tubulin suppressor-like RCC1 family protein